jgi:hypothetical protein
MLIFVQGRHSPMVASTCMQWFRVRGPLVSLSPSGLDG